MNSVASSVVDDRLRWIEWLLDTRRTRDGRTATPTIVVLDGAWNEVGVIVEHPKALLELLEDHRLRRNDAEFRQRVQNWYERDRGGSVVAEVIDMIGRQDRSGSGGIY